MEKDKENDSLDDVPFRPKQTISFRAVLIFLLFLLSFLVIIIVYFRYSEFSPFYKYFNKIASPTFDLNMSDRVIKNITTPAEGGSVEITITETELAEAIAITGSDFPMKKASLKITPDAIVINGKVSSSILGIKLEAKIVPIVENGVLVFKIKEVSALGVSAPAKVTDPMTQKLADSFQNAIPGISRVNITDARLLVGKMMIEGTKK